MLGRIICFLEALKNLVKTGCWIEHEYIDTYEPKIIIYTDNSFRVSDNLKHHKDEKVCRNGIFITSRCAVCGHVEHSWCTQAYFNNTIKTGRANI